jgi:hypothetical protein
VLCYATNRNTRFQKRQKFGLPLFKAAKGARDKANTNHKAGADAFASKVLPVIREIKAAGAGTLRQIAQALYARGIETARGGR